MFRENSNDVVVDSNALTAFELLAAGLQEGVKTHEVEESALMQYLDCAGCNKID